MTQKIDPVSKANSFSLRIREFNQNKNMLKFIFLISKVEISFYSHFLQSKSINHELIKVEGKTYSNKTLNDPLNNTKTHIREKEFNMINEELHFNN